VDSIFSNCGASQDRLEAIDTAQLTCIIRESQPLLYSNTEAFLSITRICKKLAEKHQSLKYQQGSYMRLGNVYIVTENYDSARYYYREGIKFAYRHQDSSGLTGLFMNTGVSYYNEDKPRLAVKYYKRSLEVAEAFGTKNLTYQYSNIGIVYMQLGALDKFKEYALKSKKNAEEIQDSSAFPYAYNNLGIVYKQEGDLDSAFYYYHLSMFYAQKYNNIIHTADVLTNLCNLHYKQENIDSAIYYGREMVKFAQKNSLANHYFREIYIDLAIIYNGEGQPQRAIELLDSSTLYHSSIDNSLMRLNYLGTKASAFFSLGNYKEAYLLQNNYSSLNDSIKTDEKLLQLAEMEERQKIRELEISDSLELMKHVANETVLEGDIQKKDKQNKEKDRIILYVVIFSAGLLLLLGLVFVLLKQRKKSQQLISLQNANLQEKNKEITDSINYAKNLQDGLLPDLNMLNNHVSEIGLLYTPKDIVSGDFYWCHILDEKRCFISVADCTGHGVPGAMVSVLGINGLNKSVREKKLSKCHDILDNLNDEFEQTFERKGDSHQVRDGMDIGIVCLDYENNTVEFSGANNPLWIFRSNAGTNSVKVIKADKQPIGNYDYRERFKLEKESFEKGDLLVLTSDGYQDQFGGPNQKKFKPKNLRERIEQLKHLPAPEITKELHKVWLNWKGDIEQIDDVCVLVIRL
jgi:serine phosphatase RsbU (regulator of sigma subunit)